MHKNVCANDCLQKNIIRRKKMQKNNMSFLKNLTTVADARSARASSWDQSGRNKTRNKRNKRPDKDIAHVSSDLKYCDADSDYLCLVSLLSASTVFFRYCSIFERCELASSTDCFNSSNFSAVLIS